VYNKKDHIEAINLKSLTYPFVSTWYPDFWLTFLFLGMPAGDYVRDSFKSGKAAYKSSLSGIRDMANKATRRSIDNMSTGDSNGSSSVGTLEKKHRLYVKINYEKDTLSLVSRRIANMKDRIETMKGLGMTPAADLVMRKLYLQLIAEQEKEMVELEPHPAEVPSISFDFNSPPSTSS
jgi:hypothetical protein